MSDPEPEAGTSASIPLMVAKLAPPRLRHAVIARERKARFTDLSDGFVTIPGGTGTMDELWEALSWAQLGYHSDPVGLLNTAGYYDELIAFWAKMATVGFLRPQHRDLLIVADTLDVLLDRMAAHVPTQPIVRMSVSDL